MGRDGGVTKAVTANTLLSGTIQPFEIHCETSWWCQSQSNEPKKALLCSALVQTLAKDNVQHLVLP